MPVISLDFDRDHYSSTMVRDNLKVGTDGVISIDQPEIVNRHNPFGKQSTFYLDWLEAAASYKK